MNGANTFALEQLLAEVRAVREDLDADGSPPYEDGTGADTMPLIYLDPVQTASEHAQRAREWVTVVGEEGGATSRDLLLAEVLEAFACSDPTLLHRRLIRVAATALRWTETVDARARADRASEPAHVKSPAERRRSR